MRSETSPNKTPPHDEQVYGKARRRQTRNERLRTQKEILERNCAMKRDNLVVTNKLPRRRRVRRILNVARMDDATTTSATNAHLSQRMRKILSFIHMLMLLDLCVTAKAHGHEGLRGQYHGRHHGVRPGDHCWIDPEDRVQAARDQARIKRLDTVGGSSRKLAVSCTELCDGCITIDVYTHLMTFGTGEGQEILPHPTESVIRFKDPDQINDLTFDDFTSVDNFKDLIHSNIQFTNTQLVGTPFRLNWIEDATDTRRGGDYAETPMDYRIEMTRELGTGDLMVLDIYFCYTLLFQAEIDTGNPPLRVGSSSLASQQLAGKSDGIWLVRKSMM